MSGETCPSSSGVPGEKHLLVTRTCCREWVVSAMDPVNRCGICGEVPK